MKKMNLILTTLLGIILSISCDKENNTNTISYDNSLADVINAYRVEKGLDAIPISLSLSKVAEMHVKDLYENQPNGGDCNLHSWSNKGSWSACCYTNDHAQAQCMWNKPSELTSYKGNGYEIAAWSSNDLTPEQALSIWKTSSGHHNVILNKDIWANSEWKAIGSAIHKGYAVVWFGKESDND